MEYYIVQYKEVSNEEYFKHLREGWVVDGEHFIRDGKIIYPMRLNYNENSAVNSSEPSPHPYNPSTF